MSVKPIRSRKKLIVGVIVILALLGIAAVRLRGQGLRGFVSSKIRSISSLGKAVLDSRSISCISGLLQHEVIAFKSCFPVSDIASDEQLETYKTYYLSIRDVMDQHPDKIFIVVTQPPLNPAATDAKTAARARARAFANWLKSDEYLNGHPNVFTFDFFGYLAEEDPASPDYNMLREAYRDGTDSHPNATVNEAIGPLFVDFIINAIQTYRAAYPKTS